MPGEQDDYDSWSDEDARGTRSRWRRLGIAAAVIVIGGFGAISWYAYDLGRRSGGSGVAPLIVADGKPNKVRPDDPGGKVIPDQDKLVYERPRAGAPPAEAERLLPPPETPLPRPPLPQQARPPVVTAVPPSAPAPSANSESQSAASPPAVPPLAAPARPETPPARAVETAPGPAPTPGPVSRAIPAAPSAPALSAPALPPTVPAPQAVGGGQPPQAAPPKLPAAPPAETRAAAETRPAAGGAFKVQIAATRSDADARSTWTRLQAANRDLLGSLALTVQRADLGERGIYYRVQAGGLADAQSAQSLCTALKTRKVECMVVRP